MGGGNGAGARKKRAGSEDYPSLPASGHSSSSGSKAKNSNSTTTSGGGGWQAQQAANNGLGGLGINIKVKVDKKALKKQQAALERQQQQVLLQQRLADAPPAPAPASTPVPVPAPAPAPAPAKKAPLGSSSSKKTLTLGTGKALSRGASSGGGWGVAGGKGIGSIVRPVAAAPPKRQPREVINSFAPSHPPSMHHADLTAGGAETYDTGVPTAHAEVDIAQKVAPPMDAFDLSTALGLSASLSSAQARTTDSASTATANYGGGGTGGLAAENAQLQRDIDSSVSKERKIQMDHQLALFLAAQEDTLPPPAPTVTRAPSHASASASAHNASAKSNGSSGPKWGASWGGSGANNTNIARVKSATGTSADRTGAAHLQVQVQPKATAVYLAQKVAASKEGMKEKEAQGPGKAKKKTNKALQSLAFM